MRDEYRQNQVIQENGFAERQGRGHGDVVILGLFQSTLTRALNRKSVSRIANTATANISARNEKRKFATIETLAISSELPSPLTPWHRRVNTSNSGRRTRVFEPPGALPEDQGTKTLPLGTEFCPAPVRSTITLYNLQPARLLPASLTFCIGRDRKRGRSRIGQESRIGHASRCRFHEFCFRPSFFPGAVGRVGRRRITVALSHPIAIFERLKRAQDWRDRSNRHIASAPSAASDAGFFAGLSGVFAWVCFPRRNDAVDVGFWMVFAQSVRLGSFPVPKCPKCPGFLILHTLAAERASIGVPACGPGQPEPNLRGLVTTPSTPAGLLSVGEL